MAELISSKGLKFSTKGDLREIEQVLKLTDQNRIVYLNDEVILIDTELENNSSREKSNSCNRIGRFEIYTADGILFPYRVGMIGVIRDNFLSLDSEESKIHYYLFTLPELRTDSEQPAIVIYDREQSCFICNRIDNEVISDSCAECLDETQLRIQGMAHQLLFKNKIYNFFTDIWNETSLGEALTYRNIGSYHLLREV